MEKVYLDFEKNLEELQDQINKTIEIGEKGAVDVSVTLEELSKKLEAETKNIYANLTPWQQVQVSRHQQRPYTLDYINQITKGEFIELHGDRTVKDDKAMIGGFGSIDGQTVMFIGQQKGRNTKERKFTLTFGMAIQKDIEKHCV